MLFFAPDRKELKRWTLCFALVLALHVAFAAGVSYWSDRSMPGGGVPLDAMMIDMVAVAPPAPPAPLPPGPEQVEHQPPPQPVRPETPDPLAVPEKAQPPEEQVREEAEQTTAPEHHDLPADTVQKAPSAAALAAVRNAQATWHSRLVAHLKRHQRYPRSARMRHEEGVAHVRFRIDRNGVVLGYELVSSSGHASLDAATLELIQRASPLPQPPQEIPGAVQELVVPVDYSLR